MSISLSWEYSVASPTITNHPVSPLTTFWVGLALLVIQTSYNSYSNSDSACVCIFFFRALSSATMFVCCCHGFLIALWPSRLNSTSVHDVFVVTLTHSLPHVLPSSSPLFMIHLQPCWQWHMEDCDVMASKMRFKIICQIKFNALIKLNSNSGSVQWFSDSVDTRHCQSASVCVWGCVCVLKMIFCWFLQCDKYSVCSVIQ